MSENDSKKIYYLAAVALVAIVLISAVAVSRPQIIQTGGGAPVSKTLQVTGTGSISAPPDQAVLYLAVQTQAASAGQATADNAAAMAKVIQALTNIGIDKASIQTVSYTLAPVYEKNPNQSAPSKIIGYTARNAIQVTLTDLTKIGNALDAAVSAGANDVQGISFTLSSGTLSALQKQALGRAVQDADAQAKAVASTLGVCIIGPISVSPGYMFQPSYQRFGAASQTTTPIEPATLQVTSTVQVTYQFA